MDCVNELVLAVDGVNVDNIAHHLSNDNASDDQPTANNSVTNNIVVIGEAVAADDVGGVVDVQLSKTTNTVNNGAMIVPGDDVIAPSNQPTSESNVCIVVIGDNLGLSSLQSVVEERSPEGLEQQTSKNVTFLDSLLPILPFDSTDGYAYEEMYEGYHPESRELVMAEIRDKMKITTNFSLGTATLYVTQKCQSGAAYVDAKKYKFGVGGSQLHGDVECY